MMFRWLVFCLFLCSCAGPSRSNGVPGSTVKLQHEQLYIVPFETIMVPREVSVNLFDLFVDRLNQQGAEKGIEFVILKQGLAKIDPEWLATKSYLRGELFAYVEEVGSTMTDIKARSRVRLYQPNQSSPVLQLTFPTEVFYQNDYSSLPVERLKLAEQIANNLADQFLAAISIR
jgi:hypothetical protein